MGKREREGRGRGNGGSGEKTGRRCVNEGGFRRGALGTSTVFLLSLSFVFLSSLTAALGIPTTIWTGCYGRLHTMSAFTPSCSPTMASVPSLWRWASSQCMIIDLFAGDQFPLHVSLSDTHGLSPHSLSRLFYIQDSATRLQP